MNISKFSKQFLIATLFFAFGVTIHIQSVKNNEMVKNELVEKLSTQKRIANN